MTWYRGLRALERELCRALTAARWPVREFVSKHTRSAFVLDGVVLKQCEPGSVLCCWDTFHWFVGGVRFNYCVKPESFTYRGEGL
jgi:hypothetical protein